MVSFIEHCKAISRVPWQPVSGGSVLAVAAGCVCGFIFVDSVNLVFHEAGHPIFGIFGPTLGLYGGTVAQLSMPMIVTVAFWRQRDAGGAAVSAIWFFENFLHIGQYMADARRQELPLVGGGEHDWAEIFDRWGLLSADTQIAALVSTAGWLGMFLIWAWLLSRWRADQGRTSPGVTRSRA